MFRPSAAATRFAYSDADAAAAAGDSEYEALEKGGGALGSAPGAGRVSESGSAKIPAGKAAPGGGAGDGSDEEAAKME